MPGRTGRPRAGSGWTAARSKRLKELHGQGLSLNKIARQMDVSVDTIHEHAKLDGLSFDRSQVEAANIARSVDAKARRQVAVDEIYDFLGETFAAAKAVRDGEFKTTIKGEYGAEQQVALDFIPPGNRRELSASMTQLVNAATKLEAIDSDAGVTEAVSLLGRMAKALGLTDDVDDGEGDDGG